MYRTRPRDVETESRYTDSSLFGAGVWTAQAVHAIPKPFRLDEAAGPRCRLSWSTMRPPSRFRRPPEQLIDLVPDMIIRRALRVHEGHDAVGLLFRIAWQRVHLSKFFRGEEPVQVVMGVRRDLPVQQPIAKHAVPEHPL